MQQLAIFQVQCNALYTSEMAEYAFHSFQYSNFKNHYYDIYEGDYLKDTFRYGENYGDRSGRKTIKKQLFLKLSNEMCIL